MANLNRRRQEVIDSIAQDLSGAEDSRVSRMVRRYCQKNGIDATERDINDMAYEAVRRRLVAKIKKLQNQVTQLKQRVDSFHP